MINGLKGLAVLGSTGSIGTQTLDIVRAFPDRFKVVGLTAGRNTSLFHQQVAEFSPDLACSLDSTPDTRALMANSCLWSTPEEIASHPDVDIVVMATFGRIGLEPTLAALRAGKGVVLSNKEVIVSAGELVVKEAKSSGAEIIPVDSEPSAIWQCLQGEGEVSRLVLTASGGPFRKRPIDELQDVTPDEALRHPTWKMGNKITIDSSTLMNKGFEVIESHWLFDMPYEKIEVVVHPQSTVHSFVEFSDGSVKAQIGPTDMRLPIQYALSHPERWHNGHTPRMGSLATLELTFQELDTNRYPCFTLAVEAGKKGGTYPAVLSAADEVAVRLFLDRRIGFNDIFRVVEKVLERHVPVFEPSFEDILAADRWARDMASG